MKFFAVVVLLAVVSSCTAGISRSEVFVAKDGVAFGYGINHKSPVSAPAPVAIPPPKPQLVRIPIPAPAPVLRVVPQPILAAPEPIFAAPQPILVAPQRVLAAPQPLLAGPGLRLLPGGSPFLSLAPGQLLL